MLDGRRRLRSTLLGPQPHFRHVLQRSIYENVLRKHIRGIVRTQHLGKFEIAFSESILYPKIGGV